MIDPQTYTCYECMKPATSHSMDCGSKSRMDALQWLLDSLHFLPDELLEEVHGKVLDQIIERKYGKMYDPMQELTELSEELGLYDEDVK